MDFEDSFEIVLCIFGDAFSKKHVRAILDNGWMDESKSDSSGLFWVMGLDSSMMIFFDEKKWKKMGFSTSKMAKFQKNWPLFLAKKDYFFSVRKLIYLKKLAFSCPLPVKIWRLVKKILNKITKKFKITYLYVFDLLLKSFLFVW